MKKYLTIGEVSKLTHLPISTLRYYDKEKIIQPIYKNEETKYRYYTFFQIPRLNMIVHLKSLGFGNEEIKRYLDNTSSSNTLELMEKIVKDTQHEIARLKKLKSELNENILVMSKLIELEKKIGEFYIENISIEGIAINIKDRTSYQSISESFAEAEKILFNLNKNYLPIGRYGLIIPDIEYREKNIDGDIAFIFEKNIKNDNRYFIPERKFLSHICKGNFKNLKENVDAVYEYARTKKIELYGDIIINILSGSEFQNDMYDVLYIIRIAINCPK